MRSQILGFDVLEEGQIAYLGDFVVLGGYVSHEGDGGLLDSDGTPHRLRHQFGRPAVVEPSSLVIVVVQDLFKDFENVRLRDQVAPLCSWQQAMFQALFCCFKLSKV